MTNQSATTVTLLIRLTVGASAQLRNQPLPEATVFGADHPSAVCSEHLRLAFSPDCSIQLAMTPLLELVSCGVELEPSAGGVSGWTLIDHVDLAAGGVP